MDFKRGFLKSKKGRDALATDSTATGSQSKPPSSPAPSSVGNATHLASPAYPNAIDSPTASADRPKDTGVPIDLHAPPPGIRKMKPGHNRIVFSEWPRDPEGQVINSHEHPEFGKRTPNGNWIWGETLWDFFEVLRIPTAENFVTKTSGSRIADWMRHFGELTVAESELAWADSEGDPKELFPCDIGRLICDRERQTVGSDPTDESTKLFLSRVPTLQARIPFHLLPEKLIVHDPWNTLSVKDSRYDSTVPSAEKEDIVHTFELSLSKEGKQKRVAERKAAEAADKARWEKDEWRKIEPPYEKPGLLADHQFAVHAKLPPRPSRPTSIPEAHLYIRREDKCGSGNHSAVYFSELELPRWALVDDVLCEECFRTALREEIRERAKAGTLRPKYRKGIDKAPEIRRTTKVFDDLRNGVFMNFPPQPGTKSYLSTSLREIVTDEYIGPVAYLYPKVVWQSPERGPVCEHLRIGGLDPPLTARVKVCAKLSIQGDLHLAREAENYQGFPSYFFEHWNGYNLVNPLHDPTPCGALVPQFYGYYVPRGGFKPVVKAVVADPAPARQLPADYISPILLLEHCGVPIDIETMSQDEKHAAAALYFSFHEGGWAQNSEYARNVVVQDGPLGEWPAFRGLDERWRSFRLIDFGRATPLKEGIVMKKEEICRMFRLYQYAPFVPSQ